jgi:hypothetical protein
VPLPLPPEQRLVNITFFALLVNIFAWGLQADASFGRLLT